MTRRRGRPGSRLHLHLTWDGAIQLSQPDGLAGYVTRDELALALGLLRERGGELVYSREHPERRPPTAVVELFELVLSYDLPIKLLDEPYEGLVAAVPAGGTRLMAFARTGGAALVEDLLGRGAPVDDVDADGRTALMHAAEAGDLQVVRLLLAAGADPTVRDGHGDRAIDLARAAGRRRVVALLAEAAPG